MSTPSEPPNQTPPENPPAGSETPEKQNNNQNIVYQGKFGPAFWTIASIVSLTVNCILIIVLIFLGRNLFAIKGLVQNQLIGGLYNNFVKMDEAHIVTTITVSDTIYVNDTIPVVFDLPLKQHTTVVLTTDTPVRKATVILNNSPVTTDIILRKGTKLNIGLDLVVPVSQTIPVALTVPVQLTVPVDIALDKTDLHEPFTGLQAVLNPYRSLLGSLPDTWHGLPICGPFTGWICAFILGK
jgi:hypothetical protein